MSKVLVEKKLGLDGGFAEVKVEDGNLVLATGYPVAKILDPVKKNFVDKLKALIPGSWDDAIIDKAWADAVAGLAE